MGLLTRSILSPHAGANRPSIPRRCAHSRPLPPPHPVRRIDVDVTQQLLTAYEGDEAVRVVSVSTGLLRTPIPLGRFSIYWHDNFGQPMSHGCVNLPTAEAEWLFNWADVDTMVNVHE